MLRHIFGGTHRYVSMELPDVQAAATSDPRGFMEINPPPVILDEIQYAPTLLPYIKEMVDSDRKARGAFLLSGSRNILLAERTTETLAGRAAVLKLLPLSIQEQLGRPASRLPWEPGYRSSGKALAGADLWDSLLRGGFPELASEPDRDFVLWHAGYTQTYLERDVRTLRQVGDLTLFQNFLRVLAATYQVIVLRPYLANVGKRLVKIPRHTSRIREPCVT